MEAENSLVGGFVVLMIFLVLIGLMVRSLLVSGGPTASASLNFRFGCRRGGWKEIPPFILSVLLLWVIGILLFSI